MTTINRTIGRNLLETKDEMFDIQIKKYNDFINVSQFFHPLPKNISEVDEIKTKEPKIKIGHILYGIEKDGSLTWLGQIIDSGD